MRTLKLAFFGLASLFLAACDDFLAQLSASSDVDNVTPKVAVLLPLSGDLSSFGGEMRNAITMAANDRGGDLEIQYFDTRGTQEGAQAAGAQARDFGAGVVLGPLVGNNIAPARAGLGGGTPIVAFSNDVSKASPNNFVFGITPANSTRRILQYAASTGKRNIGILYPQNSFGIASEAAAQQMASGLGINIVSSLGYSADVGREGAASRQTAANEMGKLRDQVDGLFIPDSSGRLREVSSLAFFYRLDPRNKSYLGTHLMDDAALTSEPPLNGAHFSALQGSLAEFEQRFATSFGRAPRSSSVVAYDALAMVAGLRSSGQGFSAGSISNSSGFTGVLGTYRLNGNGTVERLMSVKQITPNGIQVIQTAGSSFLF